jgi:hypothetical protein
VCVCVCVCVYAMLTGCANLLSGLSLSWRAFSSPRTFKKNKKHEDLLLPALMSPMFVLAHQKKIQKRRSKINAFSWQP